MTEPRIHMLDDLAAEFARVASEHERASTRRRASRWSPRRGLALGLSTLAVVAGGAFAVPVTRAGIEDLAGSLSSWVRGEDAGESGRGLRPADDAPPWVAENGGRVITERNGIGLYVSRTDTVHGPTLQFTFGGAVQFDTVEGWRETFTDSAVHILGIGPGAPREDQWELDEQGRYALFGLTAASVARVRLTYDDGPAETRADVDGGFILLAESTRSLDEVVAYDVEGREVEHVDVSSFRWGGER